MPEEGSPKRPAARALDDRRCAGCTARGQGTGAAARLAESVAGAAEQRSLFGEILDWMLAPLLLLWPMSVSRDLPGGAEHRECTV